MSKKTIYICDVADCGKGATMGMNGFDYCDYHYEWAKNAEKSEETHE